MKYSYDTSLGPISIFEKDGLICDIKFKKIEIRDASYGENLVLHRCYKQISSYLRGELKFFDLPINIEGTDFQKKVYGKILLIPYGHTKTYKDIALEISSNKAYRAVGHACHINRLPLIIPCHRVVGSNGSLKGYLGGLKIKEKLLDIEKETR